MPCPPHGHERPVHEQGTACRAPTCDPSRAPRPCHRDRLTIVTRLERQYLATYRRNHLPLTLGVLHRNEIDELADIVLVWVEVVAGDGDFQVEHLGGEGGF